MKKSFNVLWVAIFFAVSGCGTSNKPLTSSINDYSQTTKNQQKIATEFRREGITIFYKADGDVDKLEVKGYAKTWQKQYEHVAELEAKEKLVKFLRGETVSSTRKTSVIARSLERASDNSISKSLNSDGSMKTVAEDLESAPIQSQESNSTSKSIIERQAINNAQTVTSSITVNALGALSAVRKINGETTEEGKTYVATYEWSPKEQSGSRSITNMMDRR
jgi:hypothetical protein